MEGHGKLYGGRGYHSPDCEGRQTRLSFGREVRTEGRRPIGEFVIRPIPFRNVAARVAMVLALFALAFVQVQGQARPRAADKPNVVLILMDDMGYGDIGSYGVKDARTPNLDRLAREGVRLTNAYANASNCSPTRVGLISGQYQQRYGIEWPLGAMPGDSVRGL